MSEEKQLPAISITEEMAPAIYKPNGLDQFFEQIKEAVANEVPDLSTKKGRDRSHHWRHRFPEARQRSRSQGVITYAA